MGVHPVADRRVGDNGRVLELTAEGVRAQVDPTEGGRLASLVVHDRELLVGRAPGRGPLLWGAFPMVPWAGRMRHGRFTFAGDVYQMPVNHGLHAIHGLGFDRSWTVADDGSLTLELGPPWPFGGHAVHRLALSATSLTCTLEVHADRRPMPAQVGWHPWWVKPAALELSPGAMYTTDAEGITTAEVTEPRPGPWDDWFRDLAEPPVMVWDGASVTIESSCDHWVVFDRLEIATCVEPQTGPPDGFTLAPHVVEPEHPLVATMTLRWD